MGKLIGGKFSESFLLKVVCAAGLTLIAVVDGKGHVQFRKGDTEVSWDEDSEESSDMEDYE